MVSGSGSGFLKRPSRYQRALNFLQAKQRFGMKPGLERMQRFLSHCLKRPLSYKIVHVGGTNGKGSCASILAQLLQMQGFKVGLYTSPHLWSVRERIRIDGRAIPKRAFCFWLNQIQQFERDEGCQLTFFEALTAMMYGWADDEQIDVLVQEVGLGGRLDATNALETDLSVVTGIALDHTEILGSTVRTVAGEKAGIIKTRIPVVSGCRQPAADAVLRRHAQQKDAPFYGPETRTVSIAALTEHGTRFDLSLFDQTVPGQTKYHDLKLSLLGRHQVANAAVAVHAACILAGVPLPGDVVRDALLSVHWPGRFDLFKDRDRTVVFDGAHNPSGVRSLRTALRDYFPNGEYRVVLGMLEEKDWQRMARILASLPVCWFATTPSVARGLPVNRLAAFLNENRLGPVESFEAAATAYAAALAAPGKGPVVVAGSLYLVAELLPHRRAFDAGK